MEVVVVIIVAVCCYDITVVAKLSTEVAVIFNRTDFPKGPTVIPNLTPVRTSCSLGGNLYIHLYPVKASPSLFFRFLFVIIIIIIVIIHFFCLDTIIVS